MAAAESGSRMVGVRSSHRLMGLKSLEPSVDLGVLFFCVPQVGCPPVAFSLSMTFHIIMNMRIT